MITFMTGAPGSGKTVLAVHRMLSDDRPIHTNIDVYDTSPIKFTKFVWSDFLVKITMLYAYQDDADQYIKMSKDMGIYGISIYFDECHTKLDSQKKEVVWWMSIHRHMDQEIMLITQNKGIVAQKYRLFPEIFLYAHTASMRFIVSTFKYSEFSTFAMNKGSLIRKFKHKYKKEFIYYRTGAKNKGINTLRKKTYWIIAFFAVPIVALYLIVTSFGSDQVEQTDHNKTVRIKKVDIEKKKIVEEWLACGLSKDHIKIKGWFFSTRSRRVRQLLKVKHRTIRLSESYHTLYFKNDNKILLALLATKQFSPFQHKDKK